MDYLPGQVTHDGALGSESASYRMARLVLEWCDTASNPLVIEAAVQRIIDAVGSSIAAAQVPNVQVGLEAGIAFGSGSSTVYPSGVHSTAIGAAFLNGMAAHSLEFDDYSEAAVSHPGTVVVPACLAAAEEWDLDGPAVIRGVVVGYQVFEELAQLVVAGSIHERGFHATSVMGPIAAASGCLAMLPDTSSRQILSAIGIASSTSSGLLAFVDDASWTKRFHAGWAALGGVLSAELAIRGFVGPVTSIDGQYGLVKTFGKSTTDRESVTEPRQFVGANSENWGVQSAAYKMYACCGYNHSAISAVLSLLDENEWLSAKDIESIEVGLFDNAFQMIVRPEEVKRHPRSSVDAQFSIFHSVAVAVCDRAAGIGQFTDDAAARSDLQAIRSRVTIVHDSDVQSHYPEKYGARVLIHTVDGRSLERTCLNPYGSRVDPPSALALDQKFLAGVEPVIGVQRAQSLLADLRALPLSPSVRATLHCVARGE